MAQQPQWAKFSLSRIHDHILLDETHPVGLLWTSDHPDAETYLTTHNTHKKQIYVPPAGFGPIIPASERLQTHTLDSSAAGIGDRPLNL